MPDKSGEIKINEQKPFAYDTNNIIVIFRILY